MSVEMDNERHKRHPDDADRDLLARCGRGETEAVGGLIDRYQRPLSAYLYRLLGDPEDAEEAVVDLFVRVWRGAAGFRGHCFVRHWLYRIANRLAIDRLRARDRRPIELTTLAEVEAVPSGSMGEPEAMLLGDYERRCDRQAIRLALRQLEPRDQTLIGLHYFEGYSYEEVSRITGGSLAWVKSRLHRARNRLKQVFASLRAAEDERSWPGGSEEAMAALEERMIEALMTHGEELLGKHQWGDAKAIFRRVLTQDAGRRSAHWGLVRAITGESEELSIDETRLQEGFEVLAQAYDAGVRDFDLVVMPLALMHWNDGKGTRETGLQLIEQLLRSENDAAQVCRALRVATVLLHSQTPQDDDGILRLHRLVIEETVVAASPTDQLRTYLQGSILDAYATAGKLDTWRAETANLWDRLDRRGRREVRSSFDQQTLSAALRAGDYERVLELARKKLAGLRRHLPVPVRWRHLAETHAVEVAPAHHHLGAERSALRSLDRAEAYLDRFDRAMDGDPSLCRDWSGDQRVAADANVAVGAYLCGDGERALRLIRLADARCPGIWPVLMWRAGLELRVAGDREDALQCLREAARAARSQRGGEQALGAVRKWFDESELFREVQSAPDFCTALVAVPE